MSEKLENHEINEQDLEQVAGGNGSSGVGSICLDSGALAWDASASETAPLTTVNHHPTKRGRVSG